MKATIQADGTMVITAETEIEAYALGRWSMDSNLDLDPNLWCPKLVTDCSKYPAAIQPSRVSGATQQ
ncbi:hypothetical protein DR64_761 [Paraburkholderia xenovorans LB400]|uniref:hypothetical protein n=1 Tax=Paraburkholderia xenovorans TaxID=36873 RepID=UPI0004F7310A|nr:hypothetical protein [Paraburkholderia xenovorans]AIP31256.1 hypothetical protein DR64_761 [Paraburkholderia xenovorans LB400]